MSDRHSVAELTGGGPSVETRKDLRSYLAELESVPGQALVRISREVDPVHELSAVVKALEDPDVRPVYFDRVKGSPLPVISGLFGTKERIALALGQPVDECVDWFREALERPIDVTRVDSGPVHDVRMVGDEVDLGKLPIGVHSAGDGGRFLSSGCVLVRDPRTGNVNLGLYRMQVKGRDRLTVTTGLPHDLAKIIKWGAENAVPVDFAIILGHHPALFVASQAKNPMSLDALSLAGALLGQSVEVTPALTVDLDVPAYAEVVIEGRILPDERADEGPFGEFTYYYGAGSGHLAEITAITHREDATFVDLHPTHPEHRCLWIFPGREARMLEKVREVVPTVRAVHIPLHGAGMSAYVALDKRTQGEARRALMVALSCDNYIKHVIAVDGDVDIFDDRQVLWALNVRFQADRDLMVLPYSAGIHVDPSSYTLTDRYSPGGLTTKVGFDATIPLDVGFPIRADLPPTGYEDLDLAAYLP